MILFRNTSKYRSTLTPAVIFSFLLLLISGCNQDGVGIFYQISQEEEQKESKIAELNVYQITESNTDLYALAGRSVYKQSGDDWLKISGDDYAYDIVTDNPLAGGTLYAIINNDDTNLSDGTLLAYNGTIWTTEHSYNKDVRLFDADGTFIVVQGTGSVDSVGSSTDLSVTPAPANETNISTLVFDGESAPANCLISAGSIYGGTFGGPLAETTTTFDIAASGDYRGLASDGTNLYLTTSAGQMYSSADGVDWTLIDTISSEPVQGSLAVVTIGVIDYLIIGTDDGYYELNLSGSDAVGPTATADTADPDSFAAKYPDLAYSLIHWVYPSAITADVFYLGTQNGLWRRNADGTFESM